MYIKLAYLMLLLLVIGCKVKDVIDVDDEIMQLETIEAKKAFLEKIFEDDQKVRGSEESELMLKYGNNSKEHMDYVRAQWRQDSINLVKVEKYLSLYGHPKKSEVGNAAITPWAVIHHAQGYEVRERNFEFIYGAYLNGDIDDGNMTFYLGRMYEILNRERFTMENPYTAEDEINELIKAMGLEEKKVKVQHKLGSK